MPAAEPKSRLEKLRAKEAKLKAQIRDAEARERSKRRKDETRRKIIAGALALEHAGKDAQFGATLDRLIRESVKRNSDRALFELDPIEETTSKTK